MSLVNKERLIGLFCELVRIKSPSGEEEAISKVVISKLEKLDLRVVKDNYCNVIAKLGGEGEPLILCAHLDTVAIGKGDEIQPIIREDIITSDGTTILGADNKDALSAIIEMLIVLSERNLEHRSLEIIFTKEEEVISGGAKNLDFSLLAGKECIISDLADVDYGSIALGAPYCFTFEIKVLGKRSHVKEPEQGINTICIAAKAISKIPLGKIDNLTTSNIAFQVSGLAGIIDKKNMRIESLFQENRNTVPDLALVLGEVRGIDIKKTENTLCKIEKVFSKVARKAGGQIEFSDRKLADGYLFKKNDPLALMASNTFEKQGVRPKFISSVGGSDANILNPQGIRTIVISSAHKNPHTPKEELSIDSLVKLADFFVRVVTV